MELQYRSQKRVCFKKEKNISIVENIKREDLGAFKRSVKKEVYLTIKVTIDILQTSFNLYFHNQQTIKFTNGRLNIFSILLFIFIFIPFYVLFSIFRTTRVRTDLSHCHISHNLMVQSQDRLRDLGEFSRRFENK